GHEANQHAAAANDPHFLNAFEVGQGHRQKGRGGGQRAGKNSLAGKNNRRSHGRFLTPSQPQLLLVPGDQMDAEVNGQPDENGHKGDGQNIQVPDHQRGESQRVPQPDQQAERGFERPPGSLVGVNENKGANQQ